MLHLKDPGMTLDGHPLFPGNDVVGCWVWLFPLSHPFLQIKEKETWGEKKDKENKEKKMGTLLRTGI